MRALVPNAPRDRCAEVLRQGRRGMGIFALGVALTACGADSSGPSGGGDDPSGATTGESGDEMPDGPETGGVDAGDAGDTGDASSATPYDVEVQVTLDGAPVSGAIVMQGGGEAQPTTDAQGRATLTVDPEVPGERVIIAAHPEARNVGTPAPRAEEGTTMVSIALTRIAAGDNEAYEFQDPGSPTDFATTAKCAHCHTSQVADWYASPHRTSASNPVLHDLFAGAAHAFADPASCGAAGGAWAEGIAPGTGAAGARCYLGDGVVNDLQPDCPDGVACELTATAFGGCADCHAPGIDGVLGGRSVLEAQGIAYDAGIHCDVCHKVERVDMEAPAGVGARLQIQRPLEEAGAIAPWQPLTFGPYVDVVNPRMGASPRSHFREPEFCAGCHEHRQEALIPGQVVDAERWPDGTFPVHSTYSEWLEGPFAGVAPCISCHMPPDDAGNGADIPEPDKAGVAFGWMRRAGEVRRHVWGPRQPESGLELAAAVIIDRSVEDGTLTTSVTVKNVGAGHAIPTGEPLRNLVLLVEARCGDEPLAPVGGDVVPLFAGALEVRDASQSWDAWPEAQVGQIVRVVERAGEYHDYPGVGVFGDGSLSPAEKGLEVMTFVGAARIAEVSGGVVTFDQPLPAGDLAVRGVPTETARTAGVPLAVAGAPGSRLRAGAPGRGRAGDGAASSRRGRGGRQSHSPSDDLDLDACLRSDVRGAPRGGDPGASRLDARAGG